MVSGISRNNAYLNSVNSVALESDKALPKTIEQKSSAPITQSDSFEKSASIAQAPANDPLRPATVKAKNASLMVKACYDVEIASSFNVAGTYPTSASEMKQYVEKLPLTKEQKEAALAAFMALASDEAAKGAFFTALNGPAFAVASPAAQSAFLAMSKFYPNDVSIKNMGNLGNLKWFSALSGADQERATKMIGLLSAEVWKGEVTNYSAYSYVTLKSLMNDEIKLAFSDNTALVDTDKDNATVTVNRPRIAAGLQEDNDAFLETLVLKALPINVPFIPLAKSGQSGQQATNAIATLQNSPEFTALERSVRLAYIDVIISISDDGPAINELAKLVATDSFKSLSADMQKALLDSFADGMSLRMLDNMGRLINAEWFGAADAEYQHKALELVSQLAISLNNAEYEEQLSRQYALDRLLDGDLALNFGAFATDIELTGALLNVNEDLSATAAGQSVILQKVPELILSLDVLPAPQPASLEELQQNALFKSLPKVNRNQILQNIKKSKESEALSGAVLHLLASEKVGKLAGADKKNLLAVCAGSDSNGIQNMIAIFSAEAAYSPKETTLFLAAAAASKNKSAMASEMRNLLAAPAFAKAAPDVREALLAQSKNFPNAASVKSLRQLASATWFRNMDLADKQRAAKSIAYLAEVGGGAPGSAQETLINNTIARLLSDSIPLSFVDIEDDFGGITIGYAVPGQNGISINRALIPAGNGVFPKKNNYARRAALDTIPHEVSHQVNDDHNVPDYRYFQAEYRAWYVGWVAEHGKPPTRQAAFERCVDLINLYPNIHEALFDKPEERVKMVAFMNQMLGLKDPHPETRDEILSFLGKNVKNGKSESPVPDPSLGHDMDN